MRPRGIDALAAAMCFAVVVLVPAANLLVPASSPLHVADGSVAWAGKLTCYAIVAVAMDLVWGYGGILSLCHGLFFALGAYAMGMHLMLAIGTDGMYRSTLPDFMVFLDWKELPWFWRPFGSFPFALSMAIVVPSAVAACIGFFAFRSRIRGVYFSVLTQALTYAAMLLFFRNATGLGGNNGLTDFKRILGLSLRDPGVRAALCAMSGVALAAAYVGCRRLSTTPFGLVLRAARDDEGKLRFCGFDPARYKLVAWTVSAALCGFAGALYVPQVGIVNPSEMAPASSVEIAIWVAVGGRGTLAGAALGAYLVNALKSWLTQEMPTAWLFVLGALFVAVTLLVPGGLADVVAVVRRVVRARFPSPGASPVSAAPGGGPQTSAPAHEVSLVAEGGER